MSISNSLVIPSNINELSMKEAYLCYRSLGLQVYPVDPPWAKKKGAGKKPSIEDWWEFDPQDCNLDYYFRGDKPHNIGICPTQSIIYVDLDSKPDKGASVRLLIDSDPELRDGPRHRTRGGAHLIFICDDLPTFIDDKGKIHMDTLPSQVNAEVTAELFYHPHTNIVFPPSAHPIRDSEDDPYFVYAWENPGEIPRVSWAWLQDKFGFKAPEFERKGRAKTGPWQLQFRGDLSTLDIVALVTEMQLSPVLLNAEEGKYAVLCPWEGEHGDKDPIGDSAIAIWEGERLGFECRHAHCKDRRLQQLLEWANTESPGIVDRHCKRLRIWEHEAKQHFNKEGLPQILHPDVAGKVDSKVCQEIGRIIAPHNAWFNRSGGQVVYIEQIPSGFEYSADPEGKCKITQHVPGFRTLTGNQAKILLEEFMEPGVLRKDETDQTIFVPKSFPIEFCCGMAQSKPLKGELPHILRILTAPLPLRVENHLVYPQKGFDPQFGTFLMPDAPELNLAMPIEEAWGLIAFLLSGFCFTNEQSRTHAIARLLTPFGRGILGWTTRVPLWVYIGSRPRCGKDYLNGCVFMIYEGCTFEDLPICGRDSSVETGKRIFAAARNGRRFMHFSNCEVKYLKDASLTHAVTNTQLSNRLLGQNDAGADVTADNEMEFSLSFNLGLSIAPDLEPRTRAIELAFYEEDANSRTFPDPCLHETIQRNRGAYLSALAAIYKVWEKAGFLEGQTPFTSFHSFSKIIGGVMLANRAYMYAALPPIPVGGVRPEKAPTPPEGWGDPCLPWTGDFADSVADQETSAMKALFIACEHTFGDKWVHNKDIIACIQSYQGEGVKESPLTDPQIDALSYFGGLGDDESRSAYHKAQLMKTVRAFKGRVLGGIKLLIQPAGRAIRDTYRFVRERPPEPNTPTEIITPSTDPGFLHKKVEKVAGVAGAGGQIAVDLSREGTREENLLNTSVQKIFKDVIFSPRAGCISPHLPATPATLGVDIETFGANRGDRLDPRKGVIRLVSIADAEGVITVHDLKKTSLPADVVERIASSVLVIHNALFDLPFLANKLGLWPKGVFCTQTAHRLLVPLRSVSHAFKDTLKHYLDVGLSKEYGNSDWGGALIPAQLEYARNDVRYHLRLANVLSDKLEERGLGKVFALEMALIPVVTRMELHGFAVDSGKLRGIRDEQTALAGQLEGRLRAAFSLSNFNPGSPEQVKEAFKKEGVFLIKTEEEVLCTLDDPRAKQILDYRGADKLASAAESLLKKVREGRIYAKFNPTGPVTGRFSSKEPNLQNVPVRGDGRVMRTCFVPSAPDRALIVADYSQIELRVAALVAGETVMIEAFKAGEDLHYKIAAACLRKPVEEVSKVERDMIGKPTNFGFLYGMGEAKFIVEARKKYGAIVTYPQARAFRQTFFTMYPAMPRWHNDSWRKVDSGGKEARTILGRLLLPQTDTRWARFNMLTEYVVSGSCADLLKVAMVKIAALLPDDVHLVATIHDELVFDAPMALAEQSLKLIKGAMEEAFIEMFGAEVPVEVEAKVCSNWGEK